jgi:hypothetical protein
MKIELIEPEDKRGFYEIGELKKIVNEVGIITIRREDGKTINVESKQTKLDWGKTLESFHQWLWNRP